MLIFNLFCSDETRLKIDRNLTGLINRLTESTLVKTKQAIEELWRTESKNGIVNDRLLETKYMKDNFCAQEFARCLQLTFSLLHHLQERM